MSLFSCTTEQGAGEGIICQGERLLSFAIKIPNLALSCLTLVKAGFSEGTKHPLPSHFTVLFNCSIQNSQEVEHSLERRRNLKIVFTKSLCKLVSEN